MLILSMPTPMTGLLTRLGPPLHLRRTRLQSILVIAEAEAGQKAEELRQSMDKLASLRAQLQSTQAEVEDKETELASLREVGRSLLSQRPHAALRSAAPSFVHLRKSTGLFND